MTDLHATPHTAATPTRLLRWLDPFFATALAAALAMVVLTAWPVPARAADPASEARSVTDFVAVQTLGPTVQMRQGASVAVQVSAEPRLLPMLETVVEDTRLGRTLVVRWKRGARHWVATGSVARRRASGPASLRPQVGALLVSGAGDIQADGLAGPALSARVEGSGDIRLAGVAVDQLTLAIAGSGDISATGRAVQVAGQHGRQWRHPRRQPGGRCSRGPHRRQR